MASRGRVMLPIEAHLLRDSPLARKGGFCVLHDWPGTEVAALLRDEAYAKSVEAMPVRATHSDGEEHRGGSPKRHYQLAGGGTFQDRLYRSPTLARRLEALVDVSVTPTGGNGSYSYFCTAGDHLSLHRDVEGCDLVALTLLEDSSGSGGGRHMLYPDRIKEPLSAIRAGPQEGARTIELAESTTLILMGGLVPHAVLPTSRGQRRIVSVLCFRLARPPGKNG